MDLKSICVFYYYTIFSPIYFGPSELSLGRGAPDNGSDKPKHVGANNMQ